jgi:VCBS repeat-containing protein
MKKQILLITLLAVASLEFSVLSIKAQTRVVCVGNSITEGIGTSGAGMSYPAQLGSLLGGTYSVLNCGASGHTLLKNGDVSYWNNSKLATAVNFNPDIVIISLGTNDSKPQNWDTHSGEFYGDYQALINEFRNNGKNPLIFVCFPPPAIKDNFGIRDAVIRNEILPIIQSIQDNLGTSKIDYYYKLLPYGNYFPDGIHPNNQGAAIMAQIAYNAIKNCPLTVAKLAVNDEVLIQKDSITLDEGDSLTMSPEPTASGTWHWVGPEGFSSTTRQVAIETVTRDHNGHFSAVYTSSAGCVSYQTFSVGVRNEFGCIPTPITPYMEVNSGGWKIVSSVKLNVGGKVNVGPQPLNGTWSWTGPNGFTASSRSFTINNIQSNQGGIYTALYTDPKGCPGKNDFTITVNSLPAVVVDSYAINEDGVLTVSAPGLLGNDTDADIGTTLTAVTNSVTGPSHGTVVLNGNGSFTYTPTLNYSGADSFFYRNNDGFANSNPGQVSITVNAVNDPPVAIADSYSTNEDKLLTVSAPGVLSNDTDPDQGTTLSTARSASIVTNPAHGTLTLNSDGSFTYQPDQEYSGSDSFTYKANDGTTDSNTATVSLTIVNINDTPSITAIADHEIAFNTTSDNLTFTIDDIDTNANSLTVSATSNNPTLLPLSGISLNGSGSNRTISLTPALYQIGETNITISVSDGQSMATTSFNLTVYLINSAPTDITISNATFIETTAIGKVVGSFTTTDEDVDTHTHTYQLVAGKGDDHNALFRIDGDDLITNGTYDFKNTPELSIRVSTTDRWKASYEEDFLLTLIYDPTTSIENAMEDNQNLKCYPNPSGDVTIVEFNLAKKSEVVVKVHDLTGAVIEEIDLGITRSGPHQFMMDLKAYPPGLYYLLLKTDFENLGTKIKVIR